MLCQNYSFANYITHDIEEVKPGKSMTLQEELQVAQLQVCSCPLSFLHFFHSFISLTHINSLKLKKLKICPP